MSTDLVPGLRYIPDWLRADACRSLLADIDAAEWSAELKRRVQHYGHRYNYGRRTVTPGTDGTTAPPIPSWAEELAARLAGESHLVRGADQVIVNEYQPGQGISAHVDCLPCFGPVVAALSLNSACHMDFTEPAEGRKVSVRVAPGSLIIMTGAARTVWRHAIPARKSDPGPAHDPGARVRRGRRVSVTFRTVVPITGVGGTAVAGARMP